MVRITSVVLILALGMNAHGQAPQPRLEKVEPVSPAHFYFAAQRLLEMQLLSMPSDFQQRMRNKVQDGVILTYELMTNVVRCMEAGADEGGIRRCTGETAARLDNAVLAGHLFDYFSPQGVRISNAFPGSQVGENQVETVDAVVNERPVKTKSKGGTNWKVWQSWFNGNGKSKKQKQRDDYALPLNKGGATDGSNIYTSAAETDTGREASAHIRAVVFLKERNFWFGTNEYLRTYRISGFTCKSGEECEVHLGASLPNRNPPVTPMDSGVAGYPQGLQNYPQGNYPQNTYQQNTYPQSGLRYPPTITQGIHPPQPVLQQAVPRNNGVIQPAQPNQPYPLHSN